MSRKDIQKLYAFGQARWYNVFKPIWNRLVATKAEKKLAEFLTKNLGEDKLILDLGCGTALSLEKIFSLGLPFGKYLGLDFSKDMLEIARSEFGSRPNVEFRRKDITRLNDIDEKFDVIISTWVLSHIESPADVVNQAQKLLARNGKMFLIFFSKPKWYVNFWFFSFAKYLFKSRYVLIKDIAAMKNVKLKKSFAANITSVVEIQLADL